MLQWAAFLAACCIIFQQHKILILTLKFVYLQHACFLLSFYFLHDNFGCKPGIDLLCEGKRFSLSNTQLFAILEGVDASSKTSFLTNLFKVDDKIECGFSATIGRMGLTVLNFVKNGRRDFATVMRNVNLAVIKWS